MSLESKFLQLKSLIPTSFLQDKNADWPATNATKLGTRKTAKKNDKKFLLKTRGKESFTQVSLDKQIIQVKDIQVKEEKDKEEKDEKDEQVKEVKDKEEKENFTFNIKKPVTPKRKKTHLKHVLTKLEKGQGKREILKRENMTKFLEEKKDYEFRKAELKLNSLKVQDDAKLLKKKMARIQIKKKKSEKEWKKRIKIQESSMLKKQKKRTENLKRKRPGFK